MTCSVSNGHSRCSGPAWNDQFKNIIPPSDFVFGLEVVRLVSHDKNVSLKNNRMSWGVGLPLPYHLSVMLTNFLRVLEFRFLVIIVCICEAECLLHQFNLVILHIRNMGQCG